MGRPPSSQSKRNKQRRAEYQKEQQLDKLAAFQEFEAEVLPMLRKLLLTGADSSKMREEMAPFLTAKLLSLAVTEKDAGKALALIKDQLDRTEGKAKERVETEHKFSRLKEEELDALLESRLKEVVVHDGQESVAEEGDEDMH